MRMSYTETWQSSPAHANMFSFTLLKVPTLSASAHICPCRALCDPPCLKSQLTVKKRSRFMLDVTGEVSKLTFYSNHRHHLSTHRSRCVGRIWHHWLERLWFHVRLIFWEPGCLELCLRSGGERNPRRTLCCLLRLQRDHFSFGSSPDKKNLLRGQLNLQVCYQTQLSRHWQYHWSKWKQSPNREGFGGIWTLLLREESFAQSTF